MKYECSRAPRPDTGVPPEVDRFANEGKGILAKLAHGLADNLLTLAALAATCPILIAPAMDGGMFAHNDNLYDAVSDGQKIYVFWHENILFPLYLRGHCNLAVSSLKKA